MLFAVKQHPAIQHDAARIRLYDARDAAQCHAFAAAGGPQQSGGRAACGKLGPKGVPIDIIVTDTNHPFVERHQTLAAGVDWMDYDVVIVKTGYAFPEPTQQGALCVMSLTDGATLQDTRRLPFKRIMRPMFPVDDI